MPSENLLRVENLTVTIGRQRILDSISLGAEPGKITGILGPSGAGKSTILQAVAGLLDARYKMSGTVHLGGADLTNMPAELRSMRGIAIVFQGLHLFPDMSAMENIIYPLALRKISGSVAEERATAVMQKLDIADLSQRKPNELSGGQMQRVALARALVYEPSLLLLDEPFRGLEQELREQLLADICVQARSGLAVLFVTHDRRDLSLAADSIIEIREGRLVSRVFAPSLDVNAFQTALLPSGSRSTTLVRSRITSVGGGDIHDLPRDQNVAVAKVLQRRRIAPGQVGLLVQFDSQRATLVEVPEKQASEISDGDLIHLFYQPIESVEGSND